MLKRKSCQTAARYSTSFSMYLLTSLFILGPFAYALTQTILPAVALSATLLMLGIVARGIMSNFY
ncbi:hypothetical protein EPA93_03160 [Ktedonosporobacter rubrisoli]|uniref:Uncharacterized protein n=1 Tax=Ktedonosporobacter rubrisoli TaxID=2509675 RepID=A0A4P6JIX6_KTERU|nr:hypothetical protein [Ktedonosporobacter rubrisoli]QBD75045.1 hypothetical protein EPA93_03160 [Ktedonosporobacter rubrisoli]